MFVFFVFFVVVLFFFRYDGVVTMDDDGGEGLGGSVVSELQPGGEGRVTAVAVSLPLLLCSADTPKREDGERTEKG